jgi:hypothetical protein
VKITNIRNYVELLEVFRLCLMKGLLDKQEVIRWADDIILQDEQPAYFVIELSLCGSKSVKDMVSLIHSFVGEPRPVVSGRVILGFLFAQYSQKVISLRTVTAAIYGLLWETEWNETEKRFMYGLDDAFDCAVNGIYGTVEEVEKDVFRFLEIYKDFNISNFERWSEINQTIDEKLISLSAIVDAEQEAKMKQDKLIEYKPGWWKFWKK